MLERISQLPAVNRLRHSLRAKVLRAVADAVEPYHARQLEQTHRALDDLRAELARLRTEVIEGRRGLEHLHRRDLGFATDLRTVASSAALVREHMASAEVFTDITQALAHGLSLAPTGGMALEFGVYSGRTLKMIAASRADGVYGFDSFKGLPEAWRSGYPEGTFSVDGLPEVPGAELVVGLFEDTLPGFLAEHDGPVDLLHIDCDLYSSTRTVLNQVGPRLRPGSVVVFDEYFNYPGWQEHEYRAWQEFVAATGVGFTYEGYTVDHEQVVVRVRTVPGTAEDAEGDRDRVER